jgi:Protein of unknown function (DUF2950)
MRLFLCDGPIVSLKAQREHAPVGAAKYVKSGRCFALIAWPAPYGSSGIMTLQVGQDGVVFQKDLGPGTAQAVPRILKFDPYPSWTHIEVTNE